MLGAPPRLAGEYDLGYAKAYGKGTAKLIDREPTLEVVTGSTGIDNVGPPLAAPTDRHLVLGLEWPPSPAAIPAGAALEAGRAVVERKRAGMPRRHNCSSCPRDGQDYCLAAAVDASSGTPPGAPRDPAGPKHLFTSSHLDGHVIVWSLRRPSPWRAVPWPPRPLSARFRPDPAD